MQNRNDWSGVVIGKWSDGDDGQNDLTNGSTDGKCRKFFFDFDFDAAQRFLPPLQ
jgi:hypothetical protein